MITVFYLFEEYVYINDPLYMQTVLHFLDYLVFGLFSLVTV